MNKMNEKKDSKEDCIYTEVKVIEVNLDISSNETYAVVTPVKNIENV